MEKLKEHVIHATTLSEAFHLEVDALKHEEGEDQTLAVFPLDAKSRLMGLVTNQVDKAWDTALATMWEIQVNLLKTSTKSQVSAPRALEA